MSEKNGIKVLLALPNMQFFHEGWVMGHVLTGLALAKEIVNRGGQVLFLAAGKEFDAVTREGFPVLKHQPIPFFEQTYEHVLTRNHRVAAISELYKPDVVVGENFSYLSLFGAKSLGIPHFVITNMLESWLLDPTYFLNDLILFMYLQDQLSSSFIPDIMPKNKIRFVGPVISPDINHIKNQNKNDVRKKLNIPEDKLVILVTIGGSAVLQGILKIVVNIFSMIKKENPNAYLILNDPNEIFPNTLGDENIMITRWLPNLSEYTLASDLIINHGGFLTASEAAAVGTPQILINSSFQGDPSQTSSWIENAGAGVHYPLESLAPKTLAEKITEILADKKKREAMSKAGKKLVDGMGAARATQVILDYVQKSKR